MASPKMPWNRLWHRLWGMIPEADWRMIAGDIADSIVREGKAVLDLQKALIEKQIQSLAEKTLLIRI